MEKGSPEWRRRIQVARVVCLIAALILLVVNVVAMILEDGVPLSFTLGAFSSFALIVAIVLGWDAGAMKHQ